MGLLFMPSELSRFVKRPMTIRAVCLIDKNGERLMYGVVRGADMLVQAVQTTELLSTRANTANKSFPSLEWLVAIEKKMLKA